MTDYKWAGTPIPKLPDAELLQAFIKTTKILEQILREQQRRYIKETKS